MRKPTLIVITIIFLIIFFSGCTDTGENDFNPDNRLIGAWKYSVAYEKIIMFFPDGTWSWDDSEGTWTIEDDKLVVRRDGVILATYNYEFAHKDTELTLTNIDSGESFIYEKI
jgi:hypothetical protein